MKTKEDISYNRGPNRIPIPVPKGTPVYSANNEKGPPLYYVYCWPGMTEEEVAWEKKKGILISSTEVEE